MQLLQRNLEYLSIWLYLQGLQQTHENVYQILIRHYELHQQLKIQHLMLHLCVGLIKLLVKIVSYIQNVFDGFIKGSKNKIRKLASFAPPP